MSFSMLCLALLVMILPFQLTGRISFPEEQVRHANCFYHTIRLQLHDLLLLAIFALAIRFIKGIYREKSILMLGAFLLLSLLSILLNETVSYPLALVWWFKLVLSASIFALFVASSKERSSDETMRALFCLLLVFAALECGIVVWQFFIQKAVGLAWLGEPPLKASKGIGAAFSMPGGSLWFFDSWLGIKRRVHLILRAHGTFPHPNILGGFLVLPLIALYPFLLEAKKALRKWGLRALFFLIFFALLVSFSRSALFAWALGTICYVVLQRFPKSIIKVVVPIVAISGCLMLPQLMQRGGVISSTSVSRFANQERVLLQDTAWSMVRHNPVKGVGFQHFVSSMDSYASRPLKTGEIQPVHNIYMLIAAEVGFGGLALFLMFIGYMLVRGWQCRRSPWTAALLSMLLGLLFIGGCDHYLLAIQPGRILLFLVLGLLYMSFQKASFQKDQQARSMPNVK